MSALGRKPTGAEGWLEDSVNDGVTLGASEPPPPCGTGEHSRYPSSEGDNKNAHYGADALNRNVPMVGNQAGGHHGKDEGSQRKEETWCCRQDQHAAKAAPTEKATSVVRIMGVIR